MADLDDLTLQPSSGVPPSLPPSRPPIWPVAVLGVILVGVGIWYFWFRGSPPPPATPQPAPAASAPEGRAPEPGDDIPLPPLDETDSLVRELVSALSSHPRVAAWLATNGLIRNFTVSIVNISQGPTPAQHLKRVAPEGSFGVATEGARTVIDPRSYARYDSHADAVSGIDARGAARLFATLEPRIEEAHKELGVPGSARETLERAIVTLLSTPLVEGGVEVQPDGGIYKFADPRLEALTPAQRQLLRMGPRNMRIVQAKLREIAEYLGIPSASLPPERVHGR